MIAYLEKKNPRLDAFSWFDILRIAREQNFEFDALARLGSDIDEEGLWAVPIESLSRPSILQNKVGVIEDTA